MIYRMITDFVESYRELKKLISPTHAMPSDIVAEAKSVTDAPAGNTVSSNEEVSAENA